MEAKVSASGKVAIDQEIFRRNLPQKLSTESGRAHQTFEKAYLHEREIRNPKTRKNYAQDNKVIDQIHTKKEIFKLGAIKGRIIVIKRKKFISEEIDGTL